MKRGLFSKKIFPQERTYSQDIRRNDAETDDDKADEHGQDNVHDEVVPVSIKKVAYARKVWQKEEVDEVDIQRTSSNVLQ